MRVLLFLLCALATLSAMGVMSVAKSALHEIEAFILFLIAAVLLAGAGVVDAIVAARKRIEAAIESAGLGSNSDDADSDDSNGDESPFGKTAPQADDDDSANELYSQAKQVAAAGDSTKAIGILKEVIKRYPNSEAATKARRSLEKRS